MGQAVTVRASVVDFVPVYSAILYYKAGTENWKSVMMTKAGGYHEASIPASDVTSSGLAYYIEATDGSTTGTYPTNDPVNSPQIITLSIGVAQAGDANGDGYLNALDITKVERVIAGLDSQTSGADANQDGNLNALDITKVERIIAGLD